MGYARWVDPQLIARVLWLIAWCLSLIICTHIVLGALR